MLCLGLVLYAPVLKEQLLAELEEELLQETDSSDDETQEDSILETEEPTLGIPEDWIPEFSLSLEDYQKLQAKLYEVGETVCKSLVSIATSNSEDEWINATTETKNQGCGVVIHEDENYYYVLTEKSILLDYNRIRVTFDDESVADATLLKYDGNTGVAILAVEKSW